ncbi:MAG: outer membrane lipoprotein carrier protein LolA [Bacteroidales bacterium]|nr:outer membrane lipoprotein carrier protein LolA [Bacteroidales bacterium]
MKKIFLIITFAAFGFITTKAQPQVDIKAKAILDGVSAKTKTYTSMSIDFTYSIENKAQKIKESQQGTLIIKGTKYCLEIAKQKVFSDGKTVWTYLKDSKEMQINNPSNDDEAINPQSIFTLWEKGYRYKLIKEEIQGGVSVQIIDLIPIKGKSYFKVRIIIDKLKKQISKAIVYDKNGNIYTYKVNKFNTNVNANDASFTFNKANYPGVEVIDLR